MRKHRYDQMPRFSAAGIATSSILAMILVLAVSVLIDSTPYDGSGSPVASAAIVKRA